MDNKLAPKRCDFRKASQFLFFSLIFLQNLCTAQIQGKAFIKMFLPDGYAITAELAVSDDERQLGLMYRKKINPDQGMLLVFEQENFYSIWMKNMKFLWISSGWIERKGSFISNVMSPPVKRIPARPTPLDSQPCMFWS